MPERLRKIMIGIIVIIGIGVVAGATLYAITRVSDVRAINIFGVGLIFTGLAFLFVGAYGIWRTDMLTSCVCCGAKSIFPQGQDDSLYDLKDRLHLRHDDRLCDHCIHVLRWGLKAMEKTDGD